MSLNTPTAPKKQPNKVLVLRFETVPGSRRRKMLFIPNRATLDEFYEIIKQSFPKTVWRKVRLISMQMNRPFEMASTEQRDYLKMTRGREGMGRGVQRGR